MTEPLLAIWNEYLETERRAAQLDCGGRASEALILEAYDLRQTILEADPQTLVGIAVQARAATIEILLSSAPDERTWALKHLRRLEHQAGLEPDPYPSEYLPR